MFAGAAVVAIGILLLVLIGCAAHVWLARRAQVNGTEFRGEVRSRLFTYITESRPSPRGALPDEESPLGSRTATAQRSRAADQS
jgi:hypothetical protein